MTRILVSNDDGYLAEGLVALAEAMADLGEVWVVAPDQADKAALVRRRWDAHRLLVSGDQPPDERGASGADGRRNQPWSEPGG